MRILLVSILISLKVVAYGQNTIDCDKLLEQEPNFTKGTLKPTDSLFLKDLAILKNCGHLNDDDSVLLTGPLLGTIMLKQINLNKPITYKLILAEINAVKANDNYKDMISLKQLEHKKVDTLNWNQNIQTLKKLGLSNAELSSFKDFISLPQNKNLTYKLAFGIFFNKIPIVREEPYKFRPLVRYETALKESKLNNKMLLLYFSGHGNIHSSIMEEEVMSDASIKAVLGQKFITFIAYTDDQRQLSPNNQQTSKVNGKKISTIGQEFIELQFLKFKSIHQPFFVIIDENEKTIAQMEYTNDKKEFLNFLNHH